jgi:hypothetical protein
MSKFYHISQYWKINMSQLEDELKKIKDINQLKNFIEITDKVIKKLFKRLDYIDSYSIPDRFEAHLVSINLNFIYLILSELVESYENFLGSKGTEEERFWKNIFEKTKQNAEKFLPFPPELITKLPKNYRQKILHHNKVLNFLEEALYNETEKINLESYFKKLYAELSTLEQDFFYN